MSQIRVTDLTFCYEGSYDNIFENVSFQIDTDWKLGFIGRNGRGKTTFLKLLMGELEYRGSISSSVKFDYFPLQISDERLRTLDQIKDDKDEIERLNNLMALKHSLTRLKGKELDIIQKRYYQDMTQTEIAGVLGISQAQVSRLEKNAIAVLKKEFDS